MTDRREGGPAISRQEGIAILDRVFSFLPPPLRLLGRYLGFYEAILSGTVRDSGDLYEAIPRWMLRFQDSNYTNLARELTALIELDGRIIQLGCGRGDLLRRLAANGATQLVGIDRCEGMVRAASRRLRAVPGAAVIRARVETLDFSAYAPIQTVIIVNFWGMLPPDASRQLLERIRPHLSETGIIVIGDCRSGEAPEHVRQALRDSADKLGFYLAYPPFMAFDECGYTSRVEPLANGEYYVLGTG